MNNNRGEVDAHSLSAGVLVDSGISIDRYNTHKKEEKRFLIFLL